jgi:hypothetical protein
VPKYDFVIGGAPGWSCGLTPYPEDTGLALLPETSEDIAAFPGLATPPDGSYNYDPGLLVVGDCWTPSPLCGCDSRVPWILFDDTWTGLKDFLQDTVYRPELAPWANINIPQSLEFGGIWVMSMQGFGPPTISRPITELVGSGAYAGPARDTSAAMTFNALLIACTNAGLQYGLDWLTCQLRATNTADGVLQFFAAHPGHSAADPSTLLRERRNVVLTQAPTVSQQWNAGGVDNQQETVALVTWVLTALNPYSWYPQIDVPVDWDVIDYEPITWIQAPMCSLSSDCLTSTDLVSETCPPETVTLTTDRNPPVCGGAMPVTGIQRYTFDLPMLAPPAVCPGTAVTMMITNNSTSALTLLGYWKLATDPEQCSERDLWPVQISGLPGLASIILDGVSGQFYATFANQSVNAVGIVGTPNGAPWIAPFIDRSLQWQLVVIVAPGSDFSVALQIHDQDLA